LTKENNTGCPKITFKNNRGISNTEALRSVFPIKDGELFKRSVIAEGVEDSGKPVARCAAPARQVYNQRLAELPPGISPASRILWTLMRRMERSRSPSIFENAGGPA
jgi:hypothetical protein